MKLGIPTLEDLYKVAVWRNLCPEALRTHGTTTKDQQDFFYENVICNPDSNHNYYSVYNNHMCVGLAGLTNIDHINGNAEISLIINPGFHEKGYGSEVVKQILDIAFNRLRLENVYGECYRCNEAMGFWSKVVNKYKGHQTTLPARKFWNGELHDAMYFTLSKEGYCV